MYAEQEMGKSIGLLAIIHIFFTGSTSSQNTSDSLQVSQIMKEAWELSNQSEYARSILKYEEAKKLATEIPIWEKVFQCENEIIGILWRQYLLDESVSRARQLLPDIIAKLGVNSLQEGKLYHNIATVKQLRGAVDSALYYYQKSSVILKKHGNEGLKALSAIYNNMGAIYREKGNLNTALEYLSKSLKTDIKYYGKDHIYVANGLMNIGAIYTARSLYDSALEYSLKAIEILKKIGNTGEMYGKILFNIGIIYNQKGQYSKAYDYHLQALRNNIQIHGKSHLTHCIYYNGIGKNLLYQSLYDSSKIYYDEALKFRDELEYSNPFMAMTLWRGLAKVQSGLGETKKAIVSINQAITMAKKFSTKNSNLNYLTNDLGLIHLKAGNYTEAKKFFQVAISLYEGEYGSKHTILTGPYRNLSEVYKSEQDYARALEYVQKSIATNHNQWEYQNLYDNPNLKGIEDKLNYLFSLEEKARILNLMHKKDSGTKEFYASLDTYRAIDEVIRNLRKAFSEITDKGKFQEITSHVYEQAITAHFKAFTLTKDIDHLEKCYYYSEVSKAGILSDVINTIDARNWSNLPTELLDLEEESKADIVYYQSLLKKEKLKTEDKDSSKILLYENELFTKRHSLDSIISVFETQYSAYHQIKYKDRIASIAEIQNHLPHGTKLIEYFLGDSVGYAFVLSKQDFYVKEIDQPQTIPALTESFRNELDLEGRLDSDYTSSPQSYLDIGYQLYSKLINPFLKTDDEENIDKLIIIPDSELGYLPFELLVSENVNAPHSNSSENPYLIKDYAVSYSYSSTLLLQPVRTLNKEISYLSFAPSYYVSDTISNTEVSLGKFRDQLVPLDWNQKEASLIDEFIEGSAYLGSNATEIAFKERSSNAEILHFAMHAFVDDDDPMNSKLVFYQGNDTIEDGYLHTFELYNMKLNADLAVLSACNTGYGKLVNGEGIMSLARGFVYAGVPSVVMTHWRVDDQSTNTLMKYFYENLAEGIEKSEALRQAKLKYLQEASPNKQHPFFWGAFVVLGDDSPIVHNSIRLWLLCGLTVTLLLMIILVYLSRVKKQKTY